jgi:hypothetical protein
MVSQGSSNTSSSSSNTNTSSNCSNFATEVATAAEGRRSSFYETEQDGGSTESSIPGWITGPEADAELKQQWQQLQGQQQAGVLATELSLQLPFGRQLLLTQALVQTKTMTQQASGAEDEAAQGSPQEHYQPQPSNNNSSSSSSSVPGVVAPTAAAATAAAAAGSHSSTSHGTVAPATMAAGAAESAQPPGAGHCLAAYFTFEQLCGTRSLLLGLGQGGPMSAADYLALAQQCPRVFIQGIPQFGRHQRDEARRLVTLVDVLYNAHVQGGDGRASECLWQRLRVLVLSSVAGPYRPL